MGNHKYPCTHCNWVKYPDQCQNKNCEAWKRWFLYHWEAVRRLWQT